MKRFGCLSLLLLLALAGCRPGTPHGRAGLTPPPTAPAGVEGTVTDDRGRPVPGAVVTLSGGALAVPRASTTDARGAFALGGLPEGAGYLIKVEATGYPDLERRNLTLKGGSVTAVPLMFVAATPSKPADVADLSRVQAQAENGSGGLGGVAGGVEGGVEGGVLGGVLGGSPAPARFYACAALPSQEAKMLQDGPDMEAADELLVFSRDKKEADGPPVRRAENGEPPVTQGTLRARDITGAPLGDFPLQHTNVVVDIGGYLARTVVTQTYGNPFPKVIEAVYVFPLGASAAVNDFVMEAGGRRIVGVVRPRAEAERIYREARARGQTASLLTQERPNIFTQNVANIEPGGTVKVTLTTFERLAYEKGGYEYVFPMVVGPRYIPGTPVGDAVPRAAAQEARGGWSPPTDAVPDAHRITPPVLKPGERSGHDISLRVNLDAGLPLSEVASVAHAVTVTSLGPGRRTVELSPSDAIPNRDFVLRWKVAGDAMRFGLLAHRAEGGKDGFFTLMVQPPLSPSDRQVNPREITFILDVSGSMSGLPLETSKTLVRRVLDSLRPDDAFNVFVFAGGNGQLWESPRPNTPANVLEAKRFLNDLQGSGGTEMLAGVSRAVKASHDARRLQMFVFATDGYVGDEERILAFIKEERRAARFFAFGIGNSVNRYLIDGVGSVGGGKSMVVMPRDAGAAERAGDLFFECIDSPVLVDVAVDWNGLPVSDVYPSACGDLFAGGTLNLVGRYAGSASGTAYVTGTLGGKPVRFPVKVELPEASPGHAELAPVWARWRIADLSESMLGAGAEKREALVRDITDLAVAYRLVSQYTAFVAVDESRVVGDGRPLRVLQPVDLPEGVSYRGVFGEEPAGAPVRVEAWGLTLQSTAGGNVRVGAVESGSAAAKAGVKPGARLKSLDGIEVKNTSQLEACLLQSRSGNLRLSLEPGGEAALPAP